LQLRLGDLGGRALWVVAGCLVCQLGLGLGYVFGPLLKPITEDLGLSRAVFSTSNAARLFVMSLASPVLGILVGRLGARPILLWSALLILPTFWFLSAMHSLWQLYAANVALGLLMTGFGDVTVGAVVATWVVRRRGLALGLVYTGSNLAGATLVPLVSWLVLIGSWRHALLLVGILSTAVILPFAARVVRERHAGDPAPPGQEAPSARAAADDEGLTLAESLRTRSFWVLAAALSVFFFSVLGVLAHLHAALTDAGLSKTEAGAALGTAIGMGLASKVLMGVLADRISARPAILLNQGLLLVASLVLLAVPASPFLQLFVVGFGFAYAARDVVYPLVIAECFGLRHLAPIYGALMVVLWPAGSLGEIFAGWCFDTTGSYAPAFRTYAVANALALALLFLLRRERARGG
jgi:predicted MFS family arabinose efflux permease